MKRVLVVEDNVELAFGLRNNLEIEGYAEVVSAPRIVCRSGRKPRLEKIALGDGWYGSAFFCRCNKDSEGLQSVKLLVRHLCHPWLDLSPHESTATFSE